MAALAAQAISAYNMAPKNKIKLVTIGEPRVGDQAFAQAHDGLVKSKNKEKNSLGTVLFSSDPRTRYCAAHSLRELRGLHSPQGRGKTNLFSIFVFLRRL